MWRSMGGSSAGSYWKYHQGTLPGIYDETSQTVRSVEMVPSESGSYVIELQTAPKADGDYTYDDAYAGAVYIPPGGNQGVKKLFDTVKREYTDDLFDGKGAVVILLGGNSEGTPFLLDIGKPPENINAIVEEASQRLFPGIPAASYYYETGGRAQRRYPGQIQSGGLGGVGGYSIRLETWGMPGASGVSTSYGGEVVGRTDPIYAGVDNGPVPLDWDPGPILWFPGMRVPPPTTYRYYTYDLFGQPIIHDVPMPNGGMTEGLLVHGPYLNRVYSRYWETLTSWSYPVTGWMTKNGEPALTYGVWQGQGWMVRGKGFWQAMAFAPIPPGVDIEHGKVTYQTIDEWARSLG